MFARLSSRQLRAAIAVPLLASLLAACNKPAPKTEDVRPVRAITLAADAVGERLAFSGDVRPRYESRLGFRVGGFPPDLNSDAIVGALLGALVISVVSTLVSLALAPRKLL